MCIVVSKKQKQKQADYAANKVTRAKTREAIFLPCLRERARDVTGGGLTCGQYPRSIASAGLSAVSQSRSTGLSPSQNSSSPPVHPVPAPTPPPPPRLPRRFRHLGVNYIKRGGQKQAAVVLPRVLRIIKIIVLQQMLTVQSRSL